MMEKMNRTGRICALILGFALLTAPVWAITDYSSMSDDELSALRGTIGRTGQEEKDAFRKKWRNRVRNMNQEERQKQNVRSECPRDGPGSQYGRGGSGDSSRSRLWQRRRRTRQR